MCRKLPRTNAAFLEVPGVGAAKAEKYGQAFIRVIREYVAGNNDLASREIS